MMDSANILSLMLVILEVKSSLEKVGRSGLIWRGGRHLSISSCFLCPDEGERTQDQHERASRTLFALFLFNMRL